MEEVYFIQELMDGVRNYFIGSFRRGKFKLECIFAYVENISFTLSNTLVPELCKLPVLAT